MMIEETLYELDSLNYWHADLEGIKISNKIDIFGGYMDETNITMWHAFRYLYLMNLQC